MSTVGLVSFLTAISLSMMLIPLLVRVSASLGLMDAPGPRKVHATSVPRVGGIAIFLGSITPLLIWMPRNTLLDALLAALTILFVFGVWDDKSDISFIYKFFGQIVAASIVVYWGGVEIQHFPLSDDYVISSDLAKIITVILLVGVTNAVNMSDGLDGLAGGTSMLAIGCMTTTAYLANDPEVVIFGLSLIGATLGFLRFNTYPARIFMGDSGSQLLGFCSGLICILVTQKSNIALSPMMAILVLGLPLLDVITVMVIRISAGSSPFSADRNHIHHMLLDVGFSHREAVYIIYVVQIILVLTAFLFRYASDVVLLSIYAVFCISLLSMIRHSKQQAISDSSWVLGSKKLLAKIGFGERFSWYRRVAYNLIRVLFSAILILGVFCIQGIPRDFGLLALVLLAMMLLTLFVKNEFMNTVRRLSLYVTAGFVVYFMELSQQDGGVIATYLPILYWIIAVVIAILIKMAGRSVREFSSLDFLLLAMAFIVSFFPDARIMDGIDATLVIEVVVLFYAIDVLFNRRERLEKLVLASALVSLVVVVLKSIV